MDKDPEKLSLVDKDSLSEEDTLSLVDNELLPLVDVEFETLSLSLVEINNLCFKADFYADSFHGLEGRRFGYNTKTNQYYYDSKPVFVKDNTDGEMVDMVLTTFVSPSLILIPK